MPSFPRPVAHRFARPSAVGLAMMLLAAGACSGSEHVEFAKGDSASTSGLAPLSEAQIAITTTDSAVTLALVHDTVVMGLSESVLRKARGDMAHDTPDSSDGAFARNLSGMIKSTVSRALGSRIICPVSEIDDVRYEDGEIRFDLRNRSHGMNFESVHTDGNKPALASFSPNDAQRFVAAVRAAKARG